MEKSARLKTLSACFVLALCEFLYRGPMRTLRSYDVTDFNTSYVASRLWLKGENAYDPANFMAEWVGAGGHKFVDRGSPTNLRPAYPPSALPILAPLARLPWIAAKWSLLALSLALFPIMIWAVLKIYGIAWASTESLALSTYSFALAPWHTAIAVLSPSALAIELVIIGAALDSEPAAGILTGLSLSLKPQIGFWFLLFYLVSKCWKRAAWAFASFFVFLALGLLRLPPEWLVSYRENFSYFQAVGGVNDFTTANPIRFDLLNLQVIFYSLFHDYQMADLGSWIVTAILLAVWWQRRGGIAALALIGLLPFYQRSYNAGLLLLFIGWGLTRASKWEGRVALLASAAFLAPSAALLETFYARGWISKAVWEHSFVLNVFVGPLWTWMLLLAILVLLLTPPMDELPSRRGIPV